MQPDGTSVPVRVFGDEFFGGLTDLNGNPVIRGTDGYVYYARFENGALSPSAERVSAGGAARTRSGGIPVSLRMQAQERRLQQRRQYARELGRFPLPGTVGSGAGGNSAAGPPAFLSRGGSRVPGSGPAELRTLVLLAEFRDIRFSVSDPAARFDRMLNQKGYAADGAAGSVADYFNDNFAGTVSFAFDVQGVYTLSNDAEYYGAPSGGAPDIRPGDLVAEACRLAAADGVDFSRYDSDGDGTVDRIAVIFAGYNQAEGAPEYTIWPHHSSIENRNVTVGGVKAGPYSCTSELGGNSGSRTAGIGTFCHEFAHFFGLPDLYDVNYEEEGLSPGVYGSLSLMDSGSYLNEGRTPPYLNAVERELLGLAVPEEVVPGEKYELESVSGNRILYIGTLRPGEYFLAECRTRGGWDRYVGGEGMIVYHIDKSDREAGGLSAAERWKFDVVNAYAPHPCVRVLAAGGGGSSAPMPSVFFPGTGFNRELSYTSVPALADWDGNATGVRISDIGYASGKVTFSTAAARGHDASLPGISAYVCTPYQRDIRLEWTPGFEVADGAWEISWGLRDAGAETVYTGTARTSGLQWVIEDLEPGREYAVRICAVRNEGMGEAASWMCRTDAITSPYPYMRIRGRYSRGESADLRIYNLPDDCTRVRWQVNGDEPAQARWTFAEPGEYEIRARLFYEDGSVDTVLKTVTVR